MLQYTASSFIARKTCVRLFSVKSRNFQRYCNGKRCFVTLILTRFYLKQRFCLFWLGSAVFIIIFQSTTVSSLFIIKLHFWRSILRKECFGLLATILSCFKPYVTKKSVFSLLCLKYAACSFIAGKTCFGFFAVKKSVFAFCFLKHVALTQKTRFGLLAVRLWCFQRYCKGERFPSSLQQVTLLFSWFYSKKRFFFCLAKWQRFLKFLVRLRCFQHHLSGNSLIAFMSFLITKIRSFQLYLTKNQFCSVYRQIWLFPALLHR